MNDEATDLKEFDLSDLDAQDTAEMVVVANGTRTNWTWTFAGPGHARTIAQSERLSRERIRKEAQQEAARVNGRKYKPEIRAVDDVKKSNVEFVLERLLGWSAIKMSGQEFPFSQENARALLMDERKAALLVQALDFLGDEASFTKASATS